MDLRSGKGVGVPCHKGFLTRTRATRRRGPPSIVRSMPFPPAPPPGGGPGEKPDRMRGGGPNRWWRNSPGQHLPSWDGDLCEKGMTWECSVQDDPLAHEDHKPGQEGKEEQEGQQGRHRACLAFDSEGVRQRLGVVGEEGVGCLHGYCLTFSCSSLLGSTKKPDRRWREGAVRHGS